jgi:hypothetical protein
MRQITHRFVTPVFLALLGMTGAVAAGETRSADLNGDGRVDAADLTIMRTTFFRSDVRADLNADGIVDFMDLALLKAAVAGIQPGAGRGVQPTVFVQPASQIVNAGASFTVDLWWDFTGDPTLGGGVNFAFDPGTFAASNIVIDDNPEFDPFFSRPGDISPGLINGLATGSFKGLAGDGPLYIATLTFETSVNATGGIYTLDLGPNIEPAGPFVSAITFGVQDPLFVDASIEVVGGIPIPRISVQPPQINFADLPVGMTSASLVTIASTGNVPLTIGSITEPVAPFGLLDDECSGVVLSPGEDCTVTVSFAPTAPGPAAGTLSIASDDPNRPQVDVPLTGTGIVGPAPEIDTDLAVLFESVRVGQSKVLNHVVRNVGVEPLVIGQIGVENPLEAPFGLDGDHCSGRSLAPGQACQIVLRFAPTAAGTVNADFDIPSNDPGSPSVVVLALGVGEPLISISGNGFAADLGRCTNTTTDQTVTRPLNDGFIMRCEIAGLTAAPGDEVTATIRGVASAARLSGRVLGMSLYRTRCTNETTGQEVVVNPPGPSINWNCTRAGLIVAPGDTVTMAAFGEAL